MHIHQDLLKTSKVVPAPTHTPAVPSVVPDLPVYLEIGKQGITATWVATVILGLSALGFYYLAWRVPVQKRLLHIITAIYTTTTFLTYFAIATGDGYSFHKTAEVEKHKHVPDTEHTVYRQVFWARYIGWALAGPLAILDISLVAGLGGANILVAAVADLVAVFSGFAYAFADHRIQKWGWFAFLVIAFLFVGYQLALNGRASVATKDVKTRAFYNAIVTYVGVVWAVYPIVWLLVGTTNLISVNTEAIIYAVVDLLALPIFGFWLLLTYDNLSSTSPSVNGFWAVGFSTQGTIRVGGDED
ncbi:hypothetical protein DV738_g2739, partial [Chaetothyriales sp. CBS 135597]